MTILANGLETPDYNTPGWNHIYNRNMGLLSTQLLKLRALGDVSLDDIEDGQVFVWSAANSKWEKLDK